MSRTYLGGRIVASRRRGWLVLGDLLALVVFAVAGEYRHGGTARSVVETALQFGVGWAVVGVLVGAYGARALESRGRAAGLGAAGWAGGAVVGAVVRYLTEPGASLSPIFVLVTAGVGVVVFAAWRALAASWFGAD